MRYFVRFRSNRQIKIPYDSYNAFTKFQREIREIIMNGIPNAPSQLSFKQCISRIIIRAVIILYRIIYCYQCYTVHGAMISLRSRSTDLLGGSIKIKCQMHYNKLDRLLDWGS